MNIRTLRPLLWFSTRVNGAVLLGTSPKAQPVRVNAEAWRDVTDLGAGEWLYLALVAECSTPTASIDMTAPVAGLTRIVLWFTAGVGVTVLGPGGTLVLAPVDAAHLGLRTVVNDGVVVLDVMRLPWPSGTSYYATDLDPEEVTP